MPDLDDHFRALTTIRPPETWPDLDRPLDRPPYREGSRMRRLGVAALAFLLATGGVLLAVRTFRTGATVPAPLPTATGPVASNPAPGPSPAALPEHGVFGAMADAIRQASPPGWKFNLSSDRLDGDWRLDGWADDGSGPGRLFVTVTARPGMLTAHPCADPEFRQGGRCEERPLANGDLLVLRDVIEDAGGVRTIQVVIVHPDRSGVAAEAGNWIIDGIPPSVTQGDLPTPEITRADPVYSVGQLADVVLAIDQRTRECFRHSCP
jgi:hypothetical protein